MPDLQLFISGARYDRLNQSWTTDNGSFDLYVVSARRLHTNVFLSMTLGPQDDPANTMVSFDGNLVNRNDWAFGYAPPRRTPPISFGEIGIPKYTPSYFTELNIGGFGLNQRIGDVRPNDQGYYWNPSNGEGRTFAYGDVKAYHIETGGDYSSILFDAYTKKPNGQIEYLAPNGYDAIASAPVPEPATLTLFSLGIAGIGYRFLGKKRANKK